MCGLQRRSDHLVRDAAKMRYVVLSHVALTCAQLRQFHWLRGNSYAHYDVAAVYYNVRISSGKKTGSAIH